ncbi:hypothetical protein HYW35_02705 [Candidatus Saccharibacteria bacterium]|nr:hypothetical protein [Candidatus Saccharibacteria bacterium]
MKRNSLIIQQPKAAIAAYSAEVTSATKAGLATVGEVVNNDDKKDK